jgi:hypothetical protein
MPRERTGASYTIKASKGQDQSGHHQVRHATAWAAAMDARRVERGDVHPLRWATYGDMTDAEIAEYLGQTEGEQT